MKIVHIDELPVERRGPRGRDGMASRSLIMTGDSSRADNFSFRIMHIEGDSHFSPRHHHNFAQFYYILDGEYNFGREKMTAGWLGYVPEGVYYGPLTGNNPSMIALQHGGPSGWGIIGYDQHSTAFAELKETGAFDGGIYRPNPGQQAPKAQDSYEAIWEHVRQRRIVYPEPTYSNAISMNTNLFRWSQVEGAPGAEERHYGTFTECRYGASGYRLQPGASLAIGGRGMCIVLFGSGALADATYRKQTTVYLDVDEQGQFTAEEDTEILFLGLPSLESMAQIEPSVRAVDEKTASAA